MELNKTTTDKPFDEASFITALQELKNLRPQLYSAAEYCEKSYLHSEQKQMVLDNLKEYAIRALVNAVDHLGTVAYKLSHILEEQTLDISSVDLKVTSLNLQLLTCQEYTDKEGLKQQQLLAIIPKHDKHYILPNSANKKVHFSPMDSRQQARAHLYHSGAKTLSWHLASETKSTSKGSPLGSMSMEDSKINGKTSGAFNLLDSEDNIQMKSKPASSVALKTHSAVRRDTLEGFKHLTPYRSFDNPSQKEIVRNPVRSKTMLSAFFVKQKTQKMKTNA